MRGENPRWDALSIPGYAKHRDGALHAVQASWWKVYRTPYTRGAGAIHKGPVETRALFRAEERVPAAATSVEPPTWAVSSHVQTMPWASAQGTDVMGGNGGKAVAALRRMVPVSHLRFRGR